MQPSRSAPRPDPPQLAVQLYSLRERSAARGLESVLREVAGMGFDGVELAGLHDLAPAALGDCLARYGLELAAAHVPLPAPEAIDALLDAQAAIGARLLVVAYQAPENFVNDRAIVATAHRLNTLAAAAGARGMSIGYHNHHWEFATRQGAVTAHARLFDLLDPAIFAEIDTYWARVGGVDPAEVIRTFGTRARLLHLKDGPLDDPRAPMTALGTGRMDIAAILAVSRADWHIVELDHCATDMLDAIRASYAYLTRAA